MTWYCNIVDNFIYPENGYAFKNSIVPVILLVPDGKL